jgi:hypothetical protein
MIVIVFIYLIVLPGVEALQDQRSPQKGAGGCKARSGMTRGVSLLLVSLGALLLGLCSGAQLRSESLGLVARTPRGAPCGRGPGRAKWDGTPRNILNIEATDDFYSVLSCSTNTTLVILQLPSTNMFWWVVDSFTSKARAKGADQAVLSTLPASSSTCYPSSFFTVQNEGACPACSGSWVQRELVGKVNVCSIG